MTFLEFYLISALFNFVMCVLAWKTAYGDGGLEMWVVAVIFSLIPIFNNFTACIFTLGFVVDSAKFVHRKLLERKHMKTIEIRHGNNHRVIFEHKVPHNTMKKTVEFAVRNKVNLVGASFINEKLDNVDFSEVDLTDVSFINCSLIRADFSKALLIDVSFEGSTLGGAYFHGAAMSDTMFKGAKFGRLTVTGNRPFIQIGPIGSRGDRLLCFNMNKGIYVSTGCFFGSLKEFEAAVRKRDFHPNHCDDYLETIDYVRNHFNRWNAPKEK